MKKRIVILAVALICMLSLLVGCGSLDAVDSAKTMLNDYYGAFSDQDFGDIVDMCHPSLVDDIGGAENLRAGLATRYEYYGDIDDYSITGTSFETSGGMTQVTLSVEATYETGDTLDEDFVFLEEDDDISIIGIDLK